LTGILLFAAFALFAFAQAASARNGAQSAADAAALAAAQEDRDELMEGLEGAIGVDDNWLDWLDPNEATGAGAQAAANQLADQNDATVQGFEDRTVDGNPGYWVEIETNYTVGESIIPGTEDMEATADAVAVIEPRCDFDVPGDPTAIVELNCGGDLVEIDPEDFVLDDLPDASVLFSVQLVE
jgi:hypothetical protein